MCVCVIVGGGSVCVCVCVRASVVVYAFRIDHTKEGEMIAGKGAKDGYRPGEAKDRLQTESE